MERRVRRQSPRKKMEDEESTLWRMYAEYREENAKDLEREGIGSW